MALKATIYKANLSLTDMDSHRYGEHALTLARHPSETEERLMIRLLAYALHCPANDEQGRLEYAKGLFDVDEPDIWHKDLTGAVQLWIDAGLPDETRMKRTAARAGKVAVMTYATSTHMWWNGVKNALTRLNNLAVWHIPAEQSAALAALAQRSMNVQVMVQDGTVWLSSDAGSVEIVPECLKPWQ